MDAVNAMDHEEEEEDHFLTGTLNAMDLEEEEEDQFLAAVPYNKYNLGVLAQLSVLHHSCLYSVYCIKITFQI